MLAPNCFISDHLTEATSKYVWPVP